MEIQNQDQVFFFPEQGLFCYATQPSSYVTVKQTDKKEEDGEYGTDVSCESSDMDSQKSNLRSGTKYTEEHYFLGI